MKLFKRTLSLFLAFMMVFTSVSLLASADLGNDGISWSISVKYYREAEVATKDADGNYVKDAEGNIVTEKIWIPTNKISRGDNVKARVFWETNFALGGNENFFFYHQDFLTFDPTLHTSSLDMIFNDKAGSIAADVGYVGWMVQDGTAEHAKMQDTLLYEDDDYAPLVDASVFDKYDWIYLITDEAEDVTTAATTQTGEDWTYEVNFVVNENADGYGGMFTPEAAVIREYPYDYSLVYMSKQPSGDGGHFLKKVVYAPNAEFNYFLPGPNFFYEEELAGASESELAAAKKAFEEEAETGALSVKTNIKYNLNGGTIDGASTIADATGYVGDDKLVIPANPTKIIGSGDSTTELKFLGWERVANEYTDDEGNTYYDPNGGIYYVDAETAALAGNANQAGLIADLAAQTFDYQDVTLKAVYQSPAKYQQNVYLQNIADDEYTLSTGYSAEIDAIGGDVVKAADYEVPTGFKLNAEKSTASITVSADTVETLNIYLDREVYTATFKSGKDGATVETKTGKFEAPLTAPTAAEWVGHSFTAWNPTVPATFTANGEYVAQYASAGATITVNYSYIDKANNNALVTGTFTKDSLTGYNYAIVETVPDEPAANTTYITYDEILNVEHYEFASATPASGTVSATGANVTAQFKAVEYTATFTGGTPETVGVAYYDKLTSLPEAPEAETGWQFDGWYNGDVKAVANETVITGDVTFEAKYSKIPRTVTYVYVGAPENYKPDDSYIAYIGDTVVLPDLPEDVEGYQVGDWVISGAENGIVGTSDVTVTSTWTKNTYTVTYYADEDGNNVFTTQDYEHGEALVYPEEVPEKKGYEFDAWDIAAGELVNGELEVYPSFTAIEYYLTAIGHDGEELDLSALGYTDVYYYSNKITLADLPTKAEMDEYYEEDYYVFNKWMYNGAEITATTVIPVTGDVTVTAEIVPADAVLTFNAGGAKFENGQDTVTVNLKVWDEITDEMYPAIPEYEGHTFQSWDDYPDMMDEPAKTLTIQWKKNTYTVKYVNGLTGTEISSVTNEFGTPITAPELPTATGYSFAWDIALDSIPAKNEKGETMANGGTVTVTAVPTAEKYTVTYVVDGKTVKTEDVAFGAAIDSTFIPAEADVPAGYSFIGWNLEDKATAAGALGNMPASEVTVYAVLQAKGDTKYTVEIYKESLDGEYELVETKEFTDGTAGKVAPYVVDQNVEGFTFNEEASILDELVAGDGSTVLEVYYDRKIITVVVGDNDPIDVPYGSEIDIPDEGPASPDAGQEFDKWVDEDGNTVSDPYKVPDSTDGTPVEIIPTYKNRMINVYYYVGETLIKTVPTEYTKPIDSTLRPDTVPAGYTFLGWNLDDKATEVGALGNMPADEVNVYAVLEAHTNVVYSVEIYEESLDGEYELVETKEFTNGTSGKVAPYVVDENVEGFTFNEEASILDTLVAGDGSTVLEVYYDRKTITVVVGDNDPVDVPYGTEIDLPNDVDDNDPGTQFDKWVDEDGNTVSDPYVVPDSADGTPVELTPVYKNLFFDVVFIDKLTGTTSSKNLEYTTKIPNPGTPSVEGYEFDGWYTENGDKYVAGTTTVPNADVTYYAKYTGLEVDYTVNVYFEKLDGSGWEEQSTLESGVAGETAEYTETFEGFTLDTKNSVTEATIKGDGTTVLVIYFVRNDVKITVDGEEKYVPYGTEIKEDDLKADVDPGYKVEKWTDAEGNEITFPVEIKGGETFVPVIVKDTFTATFQTEDGTQVGETITAEYGAAIEAPEAPAAPEGMTFRGWFDKSTNTYFDGKMPAKNTVYTAFYASNDEATYIVNIYIMNTEGVEELSGSYTATATIGTTQSVLPGTVACCTLDTARSNTSCVILEDNSASINLYFVRGLYTVSFDGVETDVYAGAVIPVPADPEQAGQKFLGWTPAIPDVMPEEDLAFTSTWEDEIYTITYIVGDQEIVQEYKLGDTVTAYEVTTAPAGLVFDKWSAEVPATMPAKNIVVSAVFKAAAYTVTYLDAEGNVFVSYSVAFDAVVPVPTEAPEKEFYTFTGWADVPATMPNHDVTILPVFEPIKVQLVAAPGSTTVIDRENGYIYGLEEMLTAKILDDDYLDYEGDGTLVIKPAPTGTNRYGTGAVVELYDNADGSLVETYTIIVFGDLNGDSVVNGLDVSIADDEAFYITEWSLEGSAEYQAHLVFAANLDNNAVIDNIDVTIIKHHTLGVAEIDQTTGKLIRS